MTETFSGKSLNESIQLAKEKLNSQQAGKTLLKKAINNAECERANEQEAKKNLLLCLQIYESHTREDVFERAGNGGLFSIRGLTEDHSDRIAKRREQIPNECHQDFDHLIDKNCLPNIAAATCAYEYGKQDGKYLTQEQAADKYGCSAASIRKWSSEL